MVAADDIGKFGAQAFIDARKHRNAEVDIAGEAVTMVEGAAAASEILGKKITYVPVPIEVVRKNSEDLALMLEWFERVGYSADIANLEKSWGGRPLTLRDRVATQTTVSPRQAPTIRERSPSSAVPRASAEAHRTS
jgi:hypothetical protein